MSDVIRTLSGSWRRPRALIIAGAIATVSAGGLVAWAAWSSTGNGPGAAKSLSMPGGNTPTASISGTTITVGWSASVFANGVAVQGYRIKRYAEGSTTAITPGAGCGATITALTCAENAVPAGSWQYTVTPYQGNWIGAESGKSPPVTVSTVGLIATTTTVRSSGTPSVFGQLVTFTATVSPAPPAGETVSFGDGATSLGSSTLDSSGNATVSTGALTVGSHTISASYSGDSTFMGSSGSTVQVVNKANTTTTLTSAPNPSVFGQMVTLTATVSVVAPGAGTLGGASVTFTDGTTTLGTASLSGGSATFITSALSVGSHTIGASYAGDPNFNGSSASPITQIVGNANTTTVVTSSVNPSVFGQDVIFTATVAPLSPGAGSPSGSVQFLIDGSNFGAPAALLGGKAFSDSATALAVGPHTVTATYGGNGTFNGSTSAGLTQTVNKDATTTSLTSSVDPSLFGQSVTFTAAVSANAPGSGTPTGTVTFSDGATTMGTGTLSGGAATFTTSSLSVGNHSIAASYGGDGNFLSSASNAVQQQVGNQAPTTTTLNSSSNPSVYGQPVTFTVNVTANAPASGTPTGSVTFMDGSNTLGSGTLSGGTATLQTSALAVATHTITATYHGDGNFAGSSTTLTQTVNRADSMTTLSASPTSAVSGEIITFTPTTTAVAPGAGTPTGLWWLWDGSTVVTGGSVNFALNIGLTVGTHSLTAHWDGDGNFNGSISSPVIVTVTQASSATTVTASSANPSVFGQSVSFTATVSAMPPGGGTPTGSVQFFVGGVNLGSAVALIGATATSPAIGSLPVGTSAITASYGGDANFTGSSSPSFTQTVNKDATTTSVVSSANPSLFGQSVTFTATVSASSPGAGTPSGTVTFSEGATNLGTATLSSGSASVTTSTLSVGNHTISASYGGDGNFLTSAGSVLQAVGNQVPTTTTLTSSANPSVWGQPVTFTANVTVNPPGSGTPTGTVTFMDGTTTIGSGTLSAAGTATFMTAALSTATTTDPTHSITAAYSGDGNFAASSDSLSQTVNRADTTISLDIPVTALVVGQQLTFSTTFAVVAPGAGTPASYMILYDGTFGIFAGPVNTTFSISGLAPGTHTLTAAYNGDGNLKPSTSSAVIVTVSQASTTTALSSAPNPSVFGQSVVLTATVSVTSPGSGTATGTVTFSEGAISLGTRTVDSTGKATLSTASLGVGSHVISAAYSGDGNFTSSTSASITQTVNQAGSSTAVTSSQNPSAIGQSVTFTATVSAVAPGAGTPTGTVTFQEGSSTLASGPLNGAGQATFSTSALTAGIHTIVATYGGDINYAGSSGNVVQAVNQGITNSTTTVAASANPSLLGDNVTFTATVTPAPTAGETVTFMDGSTTLGTGTLSAGGVASFTTTSPLSLGSHTINAVYPGDATLLASTGTLTQQVVRIIVSPAIVVSNSTVTVRGAGWTPNLAVGVYLGSLSPGYGYLCTVYYANADGAFTQSCTVGVNLAQGTYTVTATDGIITDTGNQVTVNPTILYLNPTYANPTNVVTISGSGFASSSNITVTLGSAAVTASVSTTNYLGQVISLSFDIPSGTPSGATTITVTDSASPPNSASVAFTVYNATIAISPTTAASGTSVTVSGSGWPANETYIQVYIGPVNPGYGFACYAFADAAGAFSQTCTVNTNLAQGTYTATATDSSIIATGNTVTVTPVISFLYPTYANPTNTVAINGSGFAASSNITVTLGGVAVTASVSTTNYLGGLSYLTFNVPSGTPSGATTITVTDSASPPNSVSIAFTVFNATITISPASVASNGTVTVSGTGWPANRTSIQIYIGPVNPGYGFVCYATADAAGAFSQSCPVNTNLAQGTYTATATDNSISTTGNQVTITPALTYLNPTYANPTNMVTVNGSGFAASSGITVKLGSVTVATSTTNYLGGLSYVTFAVPNGTAAGPTTITVTDSASPPNSATIAFTVYNATIAIAPATAAANSAVTVSGAGWPANGTGILVYLGPINGNGFLCYAAADATGAFSKSCPVSPYQPQGTYVATASDYSITATGNQVTITPVISYVTPTYANPTNQVTVVGFTFAANSNLTVKLGTVAVTPSVTSSDSLGRVNFTFNVPSGTAAGATTITVTDSASPPNSASIAFTVYNATITVSPTTVSRGGSVTVSGSGWPAASGVGITVYIGPVSPGSGFLCTVYANASGVIAATSCTVPSSAPIGTSDVLATDGSITATGNQVTVN